jgi:hypothetical protein
MVYRKDGAGNGLAKEIMKALNSLNGWGSLEIFVQDHKVTQITKRAIMKTDHRVQNLRKRMLRRVR